MRKAQPAHFRCADCASRCEVTEILSGSGRVGCLCDRCGKYQNAAQKEFRYLQTEAAEIKPLSALS